MGSHQYSTGDTPSFGVCWRAALFLAEAVLERVRGELAGGYEFLKNSLRAAAIRSDGRISRVTASMRSCFSNSGGR